MRIKSLLLLVFCIIITKTYASDQYALIIGIDKYEAPAKEEILAKDRSGWSNLDGCVNDALSMKEIIEVKYNFNKKNIKTLFNEQASRDNIIKSLEDLINNPNIKSGDVVFIYYAGHGSQVKNSLSKEMDLKDESMVPSDSYKGAKDIRDKELAQYFNRLLAKGVVLTIIYDSCHSGSIGRGPTGSQPKLRHMEASSYDAKDASEPSKPEDNGALIISAAQDHEFAKEQKDDQGNPHGAFTLALMQAIKNLPATASAQDIFSSARAILKYNGQTQEPVIAGNDKRVRGTLFGISRDNLRGKLKVAVIGKESDKLQMQGGLAVGLNIKSQLIHVKGKDTVLLEVIELDGVNRCYAKAIKGKIKDVAVGELFELKIWSSGNASNLKVYIPKSGLNTQELYSQVKKLYESDKNLVSNFVTDPTQVLANKTIYYSGEWVLADANFKTNNIGKTLDANSIKNYFSVDDKIFLNIPPSKEMEIELKEIFGSNSSVELVNDPSAAHYYLAGRYQDGVIEYSLILPQALSSDQNNSLPIRTNFIKWTEDSSIQKESLNTFEDYIYKIAKARAWLTLESPPDEGYFPFKLVIKKRSDKNEVGNQTLKKGEIIDLYFSADMDNIGNYSGYKRHIYVFALNSNGQMQLIYPRSNVENKFPQTIQGEPVLEKKIGGIQIDEPFGFDNYFMLTTDEAITDLSVFNQEGVKSRGPNNSGIMALLSNTGTTSRGNLLSEPTWSLVKVSVRTVE